jgi:hypothetical protein
MAEQEGSSPKQFLTAFEISCPPEDGRSRQGTEKPMNAVPSLSPGGENSPSSDPAAEINTAAEQEGSKPLAQIEADADRIKSAVARLTATSIEGLEGLGFELQNLQTFLKSEVERVQSEIESALAGINIIVETIAPWKAILIPQAAINPRPVRGGPAANIEPAQLRR